MTALTTSNPSAPGSELPAKPPRDGFLDVMRTIALVRVVIWHAFGIPWISWVIATMPMMFFVAGSLLASTLDRKPIATMYRRRLKRLLVPYWFYSLAVLTFFTSPTRGPGPAFGSTSFFPGSCHSSIRPDHHGRRDGFRAHCGICGPTCGCL